MYDAQLITIGVFSIIACAIIFVIAGKMTYERFSQNSSPAQVSQISATDQPLHMFAYNKCSPACCLKGGSGYSCNSGCVCMNEAQRLALTTRGNNATSQAPDLLI